uniref:Uncharacterized protein MANES_15G005300 n=1 Tax=Rhizophora mucronata TaxID=61149 RepID=A0A2P2QN32_RHIMU
MLKTGRDWCLNCQSVILRSSHYQKMHGISMIKVSAWLTHPLDHLRTQSRETGYIQAL